jgi:hypothetical protein
MSVLERVKEFYLAATLPIDVADCKTLRQARRWFYHEGKIKAAKSAKSREELRKILLDFLVYSSHISDVPLKGEIRRYLNDQDKKADYVPNSSELERNLYAEDISQQQYEAAAREYRQRESRRRHK